MNTIQDLILGIESQNKREDELLLGMEVRIKVRKSDGTYSTIVPIASVSKELDPLTGVPVITLDTEYV